MARILVVDDQPQILKMLETVLTQKGHIVTTAVDVFDAVEKLNAYPFEMMITDAVMPGGSGFDLVKTARALPRHKDMPIIMLTGRRERKDVERGLGAGSDDYIVKPVDPDVLFSKVDSLLTKKHGGTVQFAEAPASDDANHVNVVQVIGISEVGMTIHSEQPFHPGSKINLASAVFSKIGMAPPIFRVVTCHPIANENKFSIKLQFVGMTEKSLQPLRLWIRSRSVSRAG